MTGKTNKASWSKVINEPGVVVFPIITGLVIIGLMLFMVRPTITSILSARDEIEAEKVRVDKLVAKRTALEAMSPEEMTQELEALNRVLPSRKPIIGILSSILGVTEETGVVLESYGFNGGYLASESAEVNEAPETPGQINPMIVEVEYSGVYEQVKAFITKIQTSVPLMKYISANLGGSLGEESNPSFTAKLATEAYFAPPPLTKGKIGDPLPPMSPNKSEILAKAAAFSDYKLPNTDENIDVQFQKPNPFSF